MNKGRAQVEELIEKVVFKNVNGMGQINPNVGLLRSGKTKDKKSSL